MKVLANLRAIVLAGGIIAIALILAAPDREALAQPGESEPFPSASECAPCHSRSPKSTAFISADGEDLSQHGLWQGSMMAQSFFDPYWRAAVEEELRSLGEVSGKFDVLCVRCHAPAASYGAGIRGEPLPGLTAALLDPIAAEGVTCSLCHRISGATIAEGDPHSGKLQFGPLGLYRGPLETPGTPSNPPEGIEHGFDYLFEDSALCAVCHTLRTSHASGDTPFIEQSPYLEWQNSVYSDEVFPTKDSRSCQECHMPLAKPSRLARAPDGGDEPIPVRTHIETHSFLGGNAFILDMLADHAEELGVISDPETIRRGARMTRRFLATKTARLSATVPERQGGRLRFDVGIESLVGHKFPSAYPSRRAWLEVVVSRGGEIVFASGTPDEEGRIAAADRHPLPHITRIASPEDVLIYEMVPVDSAGRTTTKLLRMTRRVKDNRLLPRGWQRAGPHGEETAPVGVEGDPDFVAGGDRVAIDLPIAGRGPLEVELRLRYQTIPPNWVTPLRKTDGPAATRFVRLYDSRDRRGETIDELLLHVE